jgi:hypothetical protein
VVIAAHIRIKGTDERPKGNVGKVILQGQVQQLDVDVPEFILAACCGHNTIRSSVLQIFYTYTNKNVALSHYHKVLIN